MQQLTYHRKRVASQSTDLNHKYSDDSLDGQLHRCQAGVLLWTATNTSIKNKDKRKISYHGLLEPQIAIKDLR